MKNIKILYIALISLFAGVLISCTNDYEPGAPVSGPQVFFPNDNTNNSVIGFQERSGRGEHRITLKRAVTEGELYVYVMTEPADDNDIDSKRLKETNAIQFTEDVIFEDGEDSAELVITVPDLTKLDEKLTYSYTLVIAEPMITTPYGLSEWTVDVMFDPWNLVEGGKAKIRAVPALTGFWSVANMQELEVDLYKHKDSEMYKIRNPWTRIFEMAFGVPAEYLTHPTGGLFNFTPADLVFDCTDPNDVSIPKQTAGVNEFANGYGMAYIEAKGGALEDGVITFPKGGIIFAHEKLIAESEGRYKWENFKSNADGMFRLLFPGVKAKDYDLGVEYLGMEVGTNNETAEANVCFSYGVDVASIKYIIVNKDVELQPEEAIQSLLNGTAENILTVDGLVPEDGMTNVKITLENGLYTIVAAPVDANGKLRSREVTYEAFYFAGLGAQPDVTCQLDIDLALVGLAAPEDSATYPDYVSLALTIDGELLKSAAYCFAPTATINKLLEGIKLEGADAENEKKKLERLIEDYGNIIPEEKIIEANSEFSLLSYFGGIDPEYQLAPETEYTVIVRATNSYGRSTIESAKCATTTAPPYTGDLVLGQYRMSYSYASAEQSATFKNIFTLSNVLGNENLYYVTNLGIQDGYSWYATYDSEKNQLVLDGTVKGYKDLGCLFDYLQVPAYQDEHGNITHIMVYWSIDPDNASSVGTDPCIMNVHPETFKVRGLASDLHIPLIDVSGADITSDDVYTYNYFAAGKTSFTLMENTDDSEGDNTGDNSDNSDNSDNTGDSANAQPASTNSHSYKRNIRIPFSSVTVRDIAMGNAFRSISATSYSVVGAEGGFSTVKPISVVKYTPTVDFKNIKAKVH